MSVICHGLGLLFAFVMLQPHAPVHVYENPTVAWSPR